LGVIKVRIARYKLSYKNRIARVIKSELCDINTIASYKIRVA